MARWGAGMLAAAAVTWAVFAGPHDGEDEEVARTAALLANRVWIDHLPTQPREFVFHMVLIKHRRGKMGAIGRSSQWRHRIEGLRWSRDQGRLRVHFPQDDARAALGVKAYKCEAPHPFELCLDLDNGERTMRLYSREDWEVRVDEAGSHASLEPSAVPLPRAVEPGDWRVAAWSDDPAAIVELPDEPADGLAWMTQALAPEANPR